MTPTDLTVPPRDELVIKVLVALDIPGVDVQEVIQIHRRYLVELMQQWTRLKDDEGQYDFRLAFVVDAELFRLDSVIRWLDAVDGRLKREASEPRALRARGHSDSQTEIGGTQMSLLELHRVSKTYGTGPNEVHAVADIDLEVDRGSLIAIMGPSGSGKSTLLTIAGSLEEPTSGEVFIDGDSLQKMSHNDKARLRRRTVGYVFQEFNLLAGLTAVENVTLPLELDGVSAKKARLAGLAVLQELGLADQADALPRRAIRRRAPTGRDCPRGDRGAPSSACGRALWRARSANGEAVMRMLLSACKQGVAAVVVTHDAQLASWADRVVFLRDGRIVDQTVPPPSARVAASEPGRSHDVELRTPPSIFEAGAPVAAGSPRGDALGVAAVPARVAPAAPGPRTDLVAVAAIFVAAAVATNNPPPANLGFGTANDLASYQGAVPHLSAKVAALEHRFGRVRGHRERDPLDPRFCRHVPTPGRELARAVQWSDALARLRELPDCPERGRPHQGVASAFNVHIGQLWSEGGTQRRVVGIVEDPLDTLDNFALVVPGQVRAPSEIDLLFDAPGVNPSTIGPNVAEVGRWRSARPIPKRSSLWSR